MSRQKKKWSDLSPVQQKAIMAGCTVELIMTVLALRDLARRPASDVRGPKWLWVLSFVVQPFGPIAYVVSGRRSAD